MNKNSITKRLEALENQTTKNNRVAIFYQHSDGRITKAGDEPANPAEAASAGISIHVVYVEPAPGGGPMSEEDLEAKYPGRRERLAAWEDAVKINRGIAK
jgi:hypothetical protein